MRKRRVNYIVKVSRIEVVTQANTHTESGRRWWY